MAITSVDPDVLRVAAQRLDSAGDLLQGALRGPLSGLRLPGLGPSVRVAIGELIDDVIAWQRAVREGADALRTAADSYAEGDHSRARELQ